MPSVAASKPTRPLKAGAPPKPPSEPLPRKLGRLTLLKPIARGGMGEVYLATAGGIEGAERPCVVKIIRREHADDESFLARFFDEARIQAQLDHPGVARVLEAATDPTGKPFVVVEYVEGRNLAELRNRGSQLNASIAWPEAVAIAVTLAEALAHVHERKDANGRPLEIVHRDLSPQNVMIGYGGDVKLIDFGTARGENRKCQTVSGVVLAKPGYVAPEVANNNPGGVPADLYALGVIFWELVAGRRFLTGQVSDHVAAVAAGTRKPVPVASLVQAPSDLDTIVARLTAPRIEDRYASAREALADLLRLLKAAPSLANGERGVRPRIAHLMERLYPGEPARTRAEIGRLLAGARRVEPPPPAAPSPSPLPVESDETLFPGTRYRIIREIGRGAMGVVYEAVHVDLGRLVALKVLPKERCDSAEFETRFRTEARAIARLRHDGLVMLHDFGVAADGRPYYAMELLEGESLERRLDRDRGMDWREALHLGVETLSALETAHAAGLVHRDIKPGNLFLLESGAVKVLDFGVAQAGPEGHGVRTEDALRLIGTPEYMAPEQATGEPVDERADLYAVGAVLYELVTGRLPHAGGSAIALIDAKRRTEVEPPSVRAPQRGLPKTVDRVITRALAGNPDQRYQTAREMRAALEAALKAPERARARRRTVAASVMVLGALALGAFAARRAQDPAVVARAEAYMGPLAEKLGLRGDPDPTSPRASSQDGEPAAERDRSAERDEGVDPDESSRVGEDEDPAAPAAPDPADTTDGPDSPERSNEPDPDRAPNADEPGQTLPEELRQQVAEAELTLESGQRILALNKFRRLAHNHPDEPRVLEGWSRAAKATKGWGEALRAAIKWASVDSSPEAHLYLARTQRAVGQRYGAVATLQRLLDRNPDNEKAQELLAEYAPSRVALKR